MGVRHDDDFERLLVPLRRAVRDGKALLPHAPVSVVKRNRVEHIHHLQIEQRKAS